MHALVTAEAQATEQPQTAGPALHQALRDFTDLAPLVADDPQAQTARAYAMLATARTALVLGEAQRAADALDEALGVARGSSLPVESFGPSLEALHAQREAVFATRQPGRLQVRCNLPCVVYVDERPFVPLEGPLPPGPHRVWIEAEDPGHAVARHVVDIRAGRTEALDYTLEREPAVTDEIAAAPPAAPKRLLPRWASILGLAVGTGVAVTGGVLVAVDHRCPDLTDPRDNRCIRILNTDAGGWTLVGLGTATAIVGAVILAIDETRARRHQR
ncbi:MAG: hypothetical protein K0V04_23950 [Deltaproteobacteria bacterium]|nr:hypothetical protein [Deltaproteobacteria bacterium]